MSISEEDSRTGHTAALPPTNRSGSSMQESSSTALVPTSPRESLPTLIAAAGPAASFAWEEFFQGRIGNRNTRIAYEKAVRRFLAWTATREPDVARITPGMVGRYFNELPLSVPSKKLHLAAVRNFFDLLVQRHVMILNPAHSVRTERYSAIEGRTPRIPVEQARQLLQSIRIESILDLRDRAIIAILAYTAARETPIAKLLLGDFAHDATQFVLRFHEKRGKVRTVPVRHDLEGFLREYVAVAGLEQEPKDAPLFRTVQNGRLTNRPISGVDIWRVVKRRLKAAGLPTICSPHSFRSCVATDLLEQGVPLEDVQILMNHSDVRTTRLYDRRQRHVTRNIVERISV